MNDSQFSVNYFRINLWLNILGLLGVCGTLIIPFFYQFIFNELPCPLCLLQRVGMILIGCGFLFNINFNIRASHFTISLIGCVVTGLVATRQVLLHIMPGDLGYGSEILGLHFYTWALISSVVAIVIISTMLMLSDSCLVNCKSRVIIFLSKLSTLIFFFLVLANLLSTIFECGVGQCADNPIAYQLLGS